MVNHPLSRLLLKLLNSAKTAGQCRVNALLMHCVGGAGEGDDVAPQGTEPKGASIHDVRAEGGREVMRCPKFKDKQSKFFGQRGGAQKYIKAQKCIQSVDIIYGSLNGGRDIFRFQALRSQSTFPSLSLPLSPSLLWLLSSNHFS